MEKIIIKNFGPIEDAEIEIRKVLVLIGEQASGKSTIAKLVYFFKTIGEEVYQNFKWDSDFDVSAIPKFIHGSTGEYFLKFFSHFAVDTSDLLLEMVYDSGLTIRIKRPPHDYRGIRVRFLGEVFDKRLSELFPLFSDVKSLYDQLKNESTQASRDAIRETISEIKIEIRKKLNNLFGGSFDSRLYVPAARIESINKSTGLDGYLDERKKNEFESSDELLFRAYKRVIDFEARSLQKVGKIEVLPILFSTFPERSSLEPLFQDFLVRNRKILKGNLVADDFGLMISLEKTGKTVRMPDASSGQKSTSPIILDVAYSLASQEKVFRIIEEPEAHLFPTAQKQLIELLVFLANAQPDSQVIITTHSPYVLTAVNNMLVAQKVADQFPEKEEEIAGIYPPKFRIKGDQFAAYSLGNSMMEDAPFCASLVSEKTGLIAQNYLDTVSLSLGHEFQQMMQFYRNARIQHDA